MDAFRYKEQFIAFLKTMYPDGLPEADSNTVSLSFNDKVFTFRFDSADYKRKTLRKPAVKPKKKTFEERLTEEDFKLLKEMRINVEEQLK